MTVRGGLGSQTGESRSPTGGASSLTGSLDLAQAPGWGGRPEGVARIRGANVHLTPPRSAQEIVRRRGQLVESPYITHFYGRDEGLDFVPTTVSSPHCSPPHWAQTLRHRDVRDGAGAVTGGNPRPGPRAPPV